MNSTKAGGELWCSGRVGSSCFRIIVITVVSIIFVLFDLFSYILSCSLIIQLLETVFSLCSTFSSICLYIQGPNISAYCISKAALDMLTRLLALGKLVLVLWCLMPLSAICQICCGGQFLLMQETGVLGENHRPAANH